MFIRIFILIISLIILTVGLAFGGFYMTAYFAPKFEGVRRDVMIESRAYSEASIRRLYNLKRQWVKATPDGKRLLEATARHEFSIFPLDRLPVDLQTFYQTIK